MKLLVAVLSACLNGLVAAQNFELGQSLPVAKETQAADTKSAEAKPAESKTVKAGEYRELIWDDLLPDDWDPEGELGEIDWDNLDDADPRAAEALAHIQAVWAAAPMVKSLAGQQVKIAGFVVPLESKGEQIHEFLLVPYFGACIHTPPPPANQIVHVVAAKLPASFEVMSPFWVSGKLELVKSTTEMGVSGYQLTADSIEPFEM